MLPRQLGERLTLDTLTRLLSSESVFLGVRSIPNPVHEKIKDREQAEDDRVPAISVWVVVGEIESTVTVRKWHTRQVPEDKHKAPFLKIHIPSRDDQLLSFRACIGVKKVSEDKETHFLRNIAVVLVLPGCGCARQEKEDVPWNTDFEKHLEVEDAEHTWVELGAHEEVVEEGAGHAVFGSSEKRGEVRSNGDEEAGDDGDGHNWSKLVEDGVEWENSGDVENSGEGQSGVHTPHTRAVVRQLDIVLKRQRLSMSPNTRQETITRHLKDSKHPINDPSLCARESPSVSEVRKVSEEITKALAFLASWEFAVVVGRADPHVVHEQGEANHHGGNTEGAAELFVPRVIDLGVKSWLPAFDDHGLRLVGGKLSLCLLAADGHRLGSLGVGGCIAIRSSSIFFLLVGTIAIKQWLGLSGHRARHAGLSRRSSRLWFLVLLVDRGGVSGGSLFESGEFAEEVLFYELALASGGLACAGGFDEVGALRLSSGRLVAVYERWRECI